jgi:hypothetical protein
MNKQSVRVFPDPQPDKGLVYFYRESKMLGCAISYNIKEDGNVVGAIGNGTYCFVFSEPGIHTYSASTEAEASRTLDVQAGYTYYIECGVDMGFVAGRPALKIASALEAKSVLPSLTYVTK